MDSRGVVYANIYLSSPFSFLQVTEWVVDYSVPGGADKDGWQYAADFPVYVVERAREFAWLKLVNSVSIILTSLCSCVNRTFHGHKTMKDFVRRRRWTRSLDTLTHSLTHSLSQYLLIDWDCLFICAKKQEVQNHPWGTLATGPAHPFEWHLTDALPDPEQDGAGPGLGPEWQRGRLVSPGCRPQ